MAPQGQSPPQGLKLEEEKRKIKNKGEWVIYAPRAKHGIVQTNVTVLNEEQNGCNV